MLHIELGGFLNSCEFSYHSARKSRFRSPLDQFPSAKLCLSVWSQLIFLACYNVQQSEPLAYGGNDKLTPTTFPGMT